MGMVQGANATEGPRRLAAIPHPGDWTRMTEPFGALQRKCYLFIYLFIYVLSDGAGGTLRGPPM
jgi:hypothetical protein